MKTKKPTKKQEAENLKRNTPRGEDPARLNDLNAEKKPAPPQPGDTDQAPTPPADKSDETHAAVEKGPRPNQPIDKDKPTNPPHTENDGTLWATDTPAEKN